MRFVGVDVNATEINMASVDLETSQVSKHLLMGATNAFGSARQMGKIMPHPSWWEDVALVAIERPSGKFKNVIYAQGLVIGGFLALLPEGIIVQDFVPASWKKMIGLGGDVGKEQVMAWASEFGADETWDEHACDALAVCHAALVYNGAAIAEGGHDD